MLAGAGLSEAVALLRGWTDRGAHRLDQDSDGGSRPRGPGRVRGEDPGAWSQPYCGGGDLTAGQESLRTSLRAAIDRVLAAQGVSSVDDLTHDEHVDGVRATTAGVAGVRPIDRQDRPTSQQVVAFRRAVPE